MFKWMKSSACCAFVLMLTLSSASFAVDNVTINLSGKQRMLTQKMSKEVVLVALEIGKETNLVSLKSTRDLFDKTLKGLKDGDTSLGLHGTKKPRIVKQLEKVSALWVKFDAVVSSVIASGNASQSDVAAIANQNLPLLKEMNKAVKFYEADAASSGINPALAKAINLAGRQRMLTQKMSKEYFLQAYGHNVASNKASLSETLALFDSTLNGLINGDNSLGLSPAPTVEIKAQLEKVQALWGGLRQAIESNSNADVAAKNLPVLTEMNKAVKMFEQL